MNDSKSIFLGYKCESKGKLRSINNLMSYGKFFGFQEIRFSRYGCLKILERIPVSKEVHVDILRGNFQ